MEMVMMVGIPASGKTTWCKMALPRHVRISLDEIKNSNRKIEDRMIEDELRRGNNIVIDDTNLTAEIRQRHISVAKRYGAKVNVVFLDVDIQKAHRQNAMRDGVLRHYVLDVIG